MFSSNYAFRNATTDTDIEFIYDTQLLLNNILKQESKRLPDLKYLTMNVCVNHALRYNDDSRNLIAFLDFHSVLFSHLDQYQFTTKITKASLLNKNRALFFFVSDKRNTVDIIEEKFHILKYHTLETTSLKNAIQKSTWYKYNCYPEDKKRYRKFVVPFFNKWYRNLMFDTGWNISNFRGSIIPVIDTPEYLILNVYLYDNYLCKGVYTLKFSDSLIKAMMDN